MGYLTTYRIQIDGLEAERILREFTTDEYGWDTIKVELDGATASSWRYDVKWYDHEADLKGLSSRHPGLLITADGEGEEQGDQWRKFFRAGQMEEHHAPAWAPPSLPLNLPMRVMSA